MHQLKNKKLAWVNMDQMEAYTNTCFMLLNALAPHEIYVNGWFFCECCASGKNHLRVIIDEFAVKLCKPHDALENVYGS